MYHHACGRLALISAAVIFVVSCQSTSPPTVELAADQTLHIPIAEDIGRDNPLDPAKLATDGVEYAIASNVFDGLYRYDEQLREVPDIAQGLPDISADGLTYTFHLRSGVRFWKGDPVTAADVLYSWNRAVTTDNGAVFAPVVGYKKVLEASQAGLPPEPLAGISAPDSQTVVVRLTAPTGYWLEELGLPGAWIVDQKAIEAAGEEDWSTTQDGLVGTGPFRMTDRVAGRSLVFSPVRNWWGGTTGSLQKVELDVVPHAEDQSKGYLDGRYDILGFGLGDPQVTEAASVGALQADPNHRRDVHTWPYGRTDWLGFNAKSGPFSGAKEGRDLRLALSQAIDRRQLAGAVCGSGTKCVPATGGMISKGLIGHLDDGSDVSARFDPKTARAAIKRIDPDGSRLRGLVYYYDAGVLDQAVAANLHAQWSANLGIDVGIRGLGRPTFFTGRALGSYSLFRGSWAADYDHPQDWFDLFLASPNNISGVAAAYANPELDSLIARADVEPLTTALPLYEQAGRMILNEAALAPLLYYQRAAIVKPHVDGYGANALWDYRWTNVRILSH